jgi:hypothetical protein
MANISTTGFGLRPIKQVGQNYNNAGLSEWLVAASSALISHAALVKLTADGVVLAAGNTDDHNLGTLNGVFYTDATTNKPTFSNYSPAANTATDIVAYVNDNPMTMFEVMSSATSYDATDVGECSDQVAAVGVTPLFISRSKINGTTVGTGASAQLKILGLSRDPDHSDGTVEGFALRVQINEHILGLNRNGI